MLTLVGLKTTKKIQAKNVLSDFPVQGNLAVQEAPEEILEEYRKNIADINAYTLAIQKLNITVYGETPDWYTKDFKEKFVNSKVHAQSWLNNIMSRLLELPETIVDYDDFYQLYSGEIVDYCNMMLKDPKKDLSDKVIKDIESLKKSVTERKALIANLEKEIDTYISTLDVDKKFFDQTFESACATKKVDEEKLKKFKQHKKELEDEIKHLQDVVTGTGIAGGVLLAVAPIGFYCGPVGIVIGIFVTAAALALLITAIVESSICSQKQTELTICVQQMDETTKTVQSLDAFCTGLNQVIGVAKKAKSAAQTIRGYWNELERELEQLITDLQDGEQHVQKKLYKELINEITTTNEEWKKIVDTAKVYAELNMDIKKEVIEIPKSA